MIRHGLFGLDLSNPLIGSTIGWLDLTGAHSDYLNEDVPFLISRLFYRLRAEERASEDTPISDGDTDAESRP